jgi:transposase InsO family protein
MTTQEWYTAREISGLPGMPQSISATIRKAKRENWQSRQRAGRGGGLEYHISSLPKETRQALAKEQPAPSCDTGQAGQQLGKKLALAAKAGRQVAKRSAEEGLKSAVALSPRELQRDQARSTILADWKNYRRISGEAIKPSMESYAIYYNAGERQGLESARAIIPKISARTLLRWRKDLQTKGHLGANYGTRKGSSKVATQPEVKTFIEAMLTAYPHCRASQAIQALRSRFANRADIDLPSQGRLNTWLNAWKEQNAQVFTAITSPDQWKNKFMVAYGSMSEGIERLNQLWEFDGTPADIMFIDGRHSINGVIDVYSRRGKMFVTATAKATAVAALLRRTLLDWGVPECAKTDNGTDYKGHHMRRVFEMLEIEQDFCPPFSPWMKPHIERFFRSFAHDLVELMPGFIGHNVADRKKIEDRKQFSDRLFKKDEVIEVNMTSTEFQQFADEWCENIYHQRKHSSLNGKTPWQMTTEWTQPVQRISDPRALDLLLAEAPGNHGIRIVSKNGIRLEHGLFIAPELEAVTGEKTRVLYDPTDLGRIQVYGGPDLNRFICIAECPERTGIDRAEVAARAKAMQRERIQEERRRLKAAAKKVGVDDIVSEIRQQAATSAGKLICLPKRSEEYTSTALEAASEAVDALSEPVTPPRVERIEMLQKALLKAKLEQAAFDAEQRAEQARRNQETPAQEYARWQKIDQAIQANEPVSDADIYWHGTYQTHPDFRTQKMMAEDFADFYQAHEA